MYIRKVTHTDKKNRQDYHTFKLVESVRTERGPRQRTMLNLGSLFALPEEQWKDLANRIEGIVTGREPVPLETIKELGLEEKLRDLGFNRLAVDAAIGVIAARLIAPGSERSTHVWLQDLTALDDLLGADFGNLSQGRVYKTAGRLLR